MKEIALLIFTLIVVCFISVGCASFNENLSISGEAYVRLDKGVRISNLKLIETSNGAYETYNNKYSKDTTSMFVSLPANSSITYEVEVDNNNSEDYLLKEIISDNKSISYELIDTNINDNFSNGIKNFNIKISNLSGVLKEDTLILKYSFIENILPTIEFQLPAWNTRGDNYPINYKADAEKKLYV